MYIIKILLGGGETMDPHAAHEEHVQEDFKMDYSEWNYKNIIPLLIFSGFIIGAISIFV
jgi:hypothetical protein